MISVDAEVFKPHRSEKTKYYSIIFVAIMAIPIVLLVFLFSQGPLIFAAVLSSVILAVLFLLAYLTFVGGINYALSAKEFTVNFGLLKKKIGYNRIVDVEIVNLSLSLRLFGASVPGFHWGLFRTSIGNAHVYATQIKGEFIVITLNDGEKIAISPSDPAEFLKSLKEKSVTVLPQNAKEIGNRKQLAKRTVYIQVLAVCFAYIIFLGYFAMVYASLPEIVPVHFGFDGVANRWADKSELLILAGVAAIFPVINAALTLKFAKYERGMLLVLGAIFIAVLVVFMVLVNTVSASV